MGVMVDTADQQSVAFFYDGRPLGVMIPANPSTPLTSRQSPARGASSGNQPNATAAIDAAPTPQASNSASS
ncbi:hypothetical protein RM555_18340 [Micromonospora sp. DSM 115977]|uniref:Uncharacterized protein n=1 Tax=Micromonospora reichwaldensis TaxID=3075516 RepID=A0ABU2WYD6_9ACTN|nr:hypothetical protein [Micromonospora sp. DSM 115977]MDT0530956.1 hypothetical protein [Micromonospora sp. DSM 115977]